MQISDFSCFMKEKLLRKVIHVHLIHSRKNYYFGSVNAIFKKLGKATFLEFTDILAEGVTRYMESTRNTSYSHTRCVTAQ